MSEPLQRRLSVIVAADVVGYSRLVAADEAGTLAAMKAHRAELWDPTTEAHGGRVVGTAGDSLLIEFQSAVAAVECSLAVQRAMTVRNDDIEDDRRMRLRIGVNLGEIVVEGDDILGDGVNIAARLEALAAPDGICISDNVMRQIRGKLESDFHDGGDVALKNIAAPVHVWHWRAEAPSPRRAARDEGPPTPTEKPSIAVLPFECRAGDADQEFFADGIVEDISAGLSKFGWLFVVSRNSTAAYRNHPADPRDIARDLAVRYLLGGSLRQSGQRIRVAAQLIDAATGAHIWAERFEGKVDDVFEVLDEVTEAIVGTIAPEIGQIEIERARRVPPENLDAWGLYQRGLALFPSGSEEDFRAAIGFFDASVASDPNFVDAHALAAHMRTRLAWFFAPENRDELLETSGRMLSTALSLDPGNCAANYALGRLHSVRDEHDLALRYCEEAIRINPNSVPAHFEYAQCLHGKGDHDASLAEIDIVMQLSPKDPHIAAIHATVAFNSFMLERYEDCVQAAELATHGANPRFWAELVGLAALCRLGRSEAAAAGAARLLARRPSLTLSFIRQTGRDEVGTAMAAALKDVGIPE